MAAANALRVLSSSSACSSSSSSSSSSRKKKITTKHSSRGRRVIASSSSSSSSSSSPESNNHSPRRKKGCKPLRAILEPCVLEPRSMDEDDENCETEKITDAKKTKRTMTSNPRDENRSAATIVKTDFLVRFILSRVFTSFRRGLRRRRKEEEQAEDDKTLVLLLYLALRSKRVPVV